MDINDVIIIKFIRELAQYIYVVVVAHVQITHPKLKPHLLPIMGDRHRLASYTYMLWAVDAKWCQSRFLPVFHA